MRRVIVRRRVKKVIAEDKERGTIPLDKEKFERFNPPALGLGNIAVPSKEVDAIAAVFDLARFTDFCSQADPHLAVPEYLSRFLDWLFTGIKQDIVQRSQKEGKGLWTDLPFLAKFLGDGVLFLWDTAGIPGSAVCNVIVELRDICIKYRREFYPKIKTVVVKPPIILRCGMARGKVYSVGNRQDYVGPCINIAARLQKLSRLTFCCSRRGFDIDRYMPGDERLRFIEKSVSIRGIAHNELIWVLKGEFDSLTDEEKKFFREP